MQILKKPHITVKSTAYNKKNKYCFVVDKDANKTEIKKAIAKRYTVVVEDVKTMKYPSKNITRHTKKGVTKGKRPAYKKAIITLASSSTIDIHADLS